MIDLEKVQFQHTWFADRECIRASFHIGEVRMVPDIITGATAYDVREEMKRSMVRAIWQKVYGQALTPFFELRNAALHAAANTPSPEYAEQVRHAAGKLGDLLRFPDGTAAK